jgi:hypothetical protein
MQAIREITAYQRRVQVVEAKSVAQIAVDEADSLATGLVGLRLLYEHFPDFYEQHVAERIVTPHLLLRTACAFYRLADEVCPLQMPAYLDVEARSAERWMSIGLDDMDALGAVGEFGYYIRGPHPVTYGVGVNALLDGHRDISEVHLLTFALWHLFHATAWGLGFDLADIMDTGGIMWAAELILLLKPLPADTDVEHLLMCLKLPRDWHLNIEIPAEDLIGYAFGRTSEELANVDAYDLDVLYGGQVAHDWDDLEILGECSHQAQVIADTYDRLAMLLHHNHQTAFKRLERLLHQTNRECKRRRDEARQHPSPLIETLADYSPEEYVGVQDL